MYVTHSLCWGIHEQRHQPFQSGAERRGGKDEKNLAKSVSGQHAAIKMNVLT